MQTQAGQNFTTALVWQHLIVSARMCGNKRKVKDGEFVFVLWFLCCNSVIAAIGIKGLRLQWDKIIVPKERKKITKSHFKKKNFLINFCFFTISLLKFASVFGEGSSSVEHGGTKRHVRSQ